MLDSRHFDELSPITGMDADGRNVTVSMASVQALVPDRDRLAWTRLHLDNGIVLVEGEYEGWMDRMTANWDRGCTLAAG